MDVSIVIPAYNEVLGIPKCLDALAQQQTRHSFDVIVVDNASTDETAEVAESWRDRLTIRVISEPFKGRGAARHTGFASARTKVVLSTDADTVVPTDWVDLLVNALEQNPEAAAVTSSFYITDGSALTNLTMKFGMPLALRLYRITFGHYLLSGSTFAVRRGAYEAAGGFNPEITMLEDVDLAFRVAQVGRIIFLPQPRVETESDIFRGGFLKGLWHYFRLYLHRYGLRRRYMGTRIVTR